MDCLFCEIIAGNIPSNKLYEDDRVLAFYDINPQAPVHFLVIPKAHIASADAITADNAETVAYIFSLIPALAAKAGLTGGYSRAGAQRFAAASPLFVALPEKMTEV